MSQGIRNRWPLGGGRETEIVSNRYLSELEMPREHGGLLESDGLVIVWAKHFLSDQILYASTMTNITKGARYFFVLDAAMRMKFMNMIARLNKDLVQTGILSGRELNERIDVIFVQSILTLGNYVVINPESSACYGYAGLIYDGAPFGWVRQTAERANQLVEHLKYLVALLSCAQCMQKGDQTVCDPICCNKGQWAFGWEHHLNRGKFAILAFLEIG